jgi:hypothetical protein
MATSYTYANSILDNLIKNGWLGLCSAEPSRDTGTPSEPADSYYSRIQTNGKFSSANKGVISNNVEIQFPTARSEAGYGLMTHFFISQSQTGPAVIWGSINNPQPITQNTVPSFYEGELKLSVDTEITE